MAKSNVTPLRASAASAIRDVAREGHQDECAQQIWNAQAIVDSIADLCENDSTGYDAGQTDRAARLLRMASAALAQASDSLDRLSVRS
jgi:hypothetical protein